MLSKKSTTACGVGLLAAVLLMSVNASAAITAASQNSTGALTNVSTASVTLDMTGVDVVVAFAESTDGNVGTATDRLSTASIGGNAMTRLADSSTTGEAKNSAHYACLQLFYLVNPGLTGSRTATLTLPRTTGSLVFTVIGFSGVDKTAPVISSYGYYSDFSNSDVLVALSKIEDAMWVFGCVQHKYSAVTPIPAGSSTLYNINVNNSEPIAAGAFTYPSPLPGSTPDYVGFHTASASAGVTAGLVLKPSDVTPPTVVSINRADPNPTNLAAVDYTVTFSEPVTGVDTGDFSLATTGDVTGAAVSAVSADVLSATRTVTVNTGTGTLGTLRLDLVDNDSIEDGAGNDLGGTGTGNGNFTGQVYNIDKVAPDPLTCSVVVNAADSSDMVGAAYTNDPQNGALTLRAQDNYSTTLEVRFRNNGTDIPGVLSFTTPGPYTHQPYVLPSQNGPVTVYATFTDEAGNSTTVSDIISVDTVAPSGTFTINGGAPATGLLDVTLTITASDPAPASGIDRVQVSADLNDWSAAAEAAWTGNGDYSYTLAAGPDGLRHVHVRFVDNAGNVTGTEDIASQSIFLDTTGPQGSVIINGGAAITDSADVTLTLDATDNFSTVIPFMSISNDGATWITMPYATTQSWTLDGSDGTNTVYVKFLDQLGNETDPPETDDIELDTTIPAGQMTINNGDDYTNDQNVDVLVTTGDLDVVEIQLSLDDTSWGDTWMAYDGNPIPFSLAATEGEQTVYARLRDTAGNVSDVISDSITLDTIDPTGTIVIEDGAPAVGEPGVVTLTLDASDEGGSGVEFMRFGNTEGAWTGPEAYATTRSGWPLQAGPDGPRTVYVMFIDRAGNEFVAQDSIELDTVHPNAPTVSGPAITRNPRPTWSWVSGGGGNGRYRVQLNDEDEGSWTLVGEATTFTPDVDLADKQVHTLYVQERDAAYNWSESGFWAVEVDSDAVTAPIVYGVTPTNNPRPGWTWESGGSPIEEYRYQLDSTTGPWTETTDTAWAFTEDKEEGTYTLYVQQRLTPLMWSESGFFAITIDFTAPAPPEVSVVECDGGSGCVINSPKPTWEWVTGGGDGNGTFRYQLNDGAWSEPSEDRSFTPATDLESGVHTVYVQERDAAGNWSDSGSASVTIDLLPPGAPVVTSPPFTNNQQPTWSWTGSGSGNFRYQMNSTAGDWTETTNTEFVPDTPLDPGSYTLYVQEASEYGIWSPSGSSTTVVDLTDPNPPVVSGPEVTPNTTPTWSWISGGGGNGTFRYQMNVESGDWTVTTATEFTPAEALAAGVYRLFVQEADDAGNWSASGFWSIRVQLEGPEPPVVSGPAVTAKERPAWTWVSGGGEGTGRFRYQLNSEAGAWQLTTAIQYRPVAELVDGAYTLYVQEQDRLGNWSQSGTWTILVDTVPPAPPILDGVTPTRSTQPTWTWTPGGGGAGTFRVQIDSEEDAWTITNDLSYTPPLPLEKNAHTLYAQEADAAGNWSASSLYTIVIDPNAVNPPIVTGVTPTNDTTPTWTWESGGGGEGRYRYSLDGGDWVITEEMAFTPEVDLVEGSHTLEVCESNQFGDWSYPGSFTIAIATGLPVITILGDNPVQVSAGAAYNDAGATAIDGEGADITDSIVTTGLPVDTAVVGTYSVRYNVMDGAGNRAPEAVRTVEVVSGVTEVTLTSPLGGSTLYMSADGAPVLVALTAVAPEGTATVTYTFDDVEVGAATEAPWVVVMEITPDAALFGEHTIGVAAVDAAKDSVDSATLTIAEIPEGSDADANSIPDNPFTTLGSGDLWALDGVVVLRADAGMAVPAGAPNVVALASPANTAQRLIASVSPSVLDTGETGIVILKASNSLDTLLGAGEAALVAEPPVGYAVAGSFYGTVNIAVTNNMVNYWNLDSSVLEDFPVVVTAEDNLEADVDLLVHEAEVMSGDQGVFIGIPTGADWGNAGVVELNVVDGTATATLKALGLVAAFEVESGEGEGEGEGEPPACFAANLQPPAPPTSGDGMLLILVAVLLLVAVKMRPHAARSIR